MGQVKEEKIKGIVNTLSDLEFDIDFADFDWKHPKLIYNSDGTVHHASFRLIEKKVRVKMESLEFQFH